MTQASQTGGLCPCGSGAEYRACCEPLHHGEAAPTAERLMRSRYSAFARGDEKYIADTWHPGTKPDDVTLGEGVTWERLEVVEVTDGAEGDRRGTVTFRAHWREGSGGTVVRGVQEERSRFVWQSARWWYLDERKDN